ncbi:unnamed protein product [Pneumocystis jirovecii]|nr:unnamed protein product [Pneumocystis jirovecii]
MNAAKKKTISKPGLKITEADLSNNFKSSRNNQGLASNFQKSTISETDSVGRGIHRRSSRSRLKSSRGRNNTLKDSASSKIEQTKDQIKDQTNEKNNQMKSMHKDLDKNKEIKEI